MNNKKDLYHITVDPYNSPLNHYLRYKVKMLKFEDVKSKSLVRYYGLISGKLVKRYCKTRLLSSLTNMLLFMFSIYFAQNSGLLEYMLFKKDLLFDKIIAIYSLIFQ
jgi:hypothetical protein